MATECYQGRIPLHPHSTILPLPTVKCTPDDGICYTSLSHVGGQATAQLGCWPSQTTMELAWIGVPECKNEIGQLVCLCLESLCNGFLPSENKNIPEGGDLQGLAMVFIMLLLIVMLVSVSRQLIKLIKKHAMKESVKVENSFNNSTSFMQKDILQCHILPYYNFPPTFNNICYSHTHHLRTSSAPAYLPIPCSTHLGDRQFMDDKGCAKTTPVRNMNNNIFFYFFFFISTTCNHLALGYYLQAHEN